MYGPMMGQPMGFPMPGADPLTAAADPLALYRLFMQQQVGMGPQQPGGMGGGMGGPPRTPDAPQRGLGGFGDMGLMQMSQLRGLLGQQGGPPNMPGPKNPAVYDQPGGLGGLLSMFGGGGGQKGMAEMGSGILAAQPGYGLI